jgi:hypothetical protein
MKIAAFHKRQGDSVEWATIFERYDIAYKSKIFTFSGDNTAVFADKVIKGGTGYGLYNELFCDNVEPDYTIYKGCAWYTHYTAYGFLTRGCIRRCSWCIVPKKEGYIRPYRDIDTVLQGRTYAVLMDNNVLACEHGLRQLERIADLKCRVDFNQGLDSRLITEEIACLLSKIKWIRYIRFACDTASDVEPLLKALEKLNKYGVKNYRIFVYVLVRDVDDANDRCKILKRLGVNPFAQPYRDFENNRQPSPEQRNFARYVNHKAIFNSCSFENYKP